MIPKIFNLLHLCRWSIVTHNANFFGADLTRKGFLVSFEPDKTSLFGSVSLSKFTSPLQSGSYLPKRKLAK